MRDILTFFAMSKAILQRRYPMPWKTFFLVLFCIFYFVSPIDLLPDVLPILGITDDVTFILLVLAVIRRDLDKYRATLTAPKDNVIDIGDINEHKK